MTDTELKNQQTEKCLRSVVENDITHMNVTEDSSQALKMIPREV